MQQVGDIPLPVVCDSSPVSVQEALRAPSILDTSWLNMRSKLGPCGISIFTFTNLTTIDPSRVAGDVVHSIGVGAVREGCFHSISTQPVLFHGVAISVDIGVERHEHVFHVSRFAKLSSDPYNFSMLVSFQIISVIGVCIRLESSYLGAVGDCFGHIERVYLVVLVVLWIIQIS